MLLQVDDAAVMMMTLDFGQAALMCQLSAKIFSPLRWHGEMIITSRYAARASKYALTSPASTGSFSTLA